MSHRMRRALTEVIGTYVLVFVGTGAVVADAHTGGGVGHLGISLAFGLVVACVVYAIGHISGAHINPAVTLAFWADGRFPGRDVGGYVAAQTVGAAAASATLLWVVGDVGTLGATTPALALPQAFVLEVLLTFILMFVIIAVATDARAQGAFAGLVIGATVAFCALFGGPFTGASMNPARSFGPALVGGVWGAHWLYWIAPPIGAVAAVRLYRVLRATDAIASAEVSAHG